MNQVVHRTIRRGTSLALAGLTGLASGLLVGLPTAGPVSAKAAGPPEVDIVLDVSGSMKESAGGGASRIEAARAAVRTAVTGLPEESRLGLRTFGGCDKSTQVVPVGPLDRQRVIAGVDAARPDGDTPLAYAMAAAGGDFSAEAADKSLLVVSDGEETCGGDPVAAARKLARDCVDVRVDVIGFRVDAKTRRQLQQVAAAGCGQYVDAGDADELTTLLKKASLRAMRPVRAYGTPVTGTDAPDGAPVLKPGVYRDVISRTGGTKRYWAFDIPEGATAHVSATMPASRPIAEDEQSVFESFWLQVYGDNDAAGGSAGGSADDELDECATQRALASRSSEGGAKTSSVGREIRFGDKDETLRCWQPGRRWIEVEKTEPSASERALRDRLGLNDGLTPVEITLWLEPKVRDADALPPAYEDDEKATDDATIPFDGPAKPTVGGGAFGNAPVLRPGVYAESLRPGEETYFRVPVNWGQRLTAALRIAGERDPNTATQLTILSPTRQEAQESGSDVTSTTDRGQVVRAAPVRYNNRFNTSSTSRVSAAAIPGYYYVVAAVKPDVFDRNDVDHKVELAIQVDGEVEGVPAYVSTPGAADPATALGGGAAAAAAGDGSLSAAGGSTAGSAEDADRLVPVAVMWTGAGVGVVLLLGAALAAALLVRSRRRARRP